MWPSRVSSPRFRKKALNAGPGWSGVCVLHSELPPALRESRADLKCLILVLVKTPGGSAAAVTAQSAAHLKVPLCGLVRGPLTPSLLPAHQTCRRSPLPETTVMPPPLSQLSPTCPLMSLQKRLASRPWRRRRKRGSVKAVALPAPPGPPRRSAPSPSPPRHLKRPPPQRPRRGPPWTLAAMGLQASPRPRRRRSSAPPPS